MCTFKGVSEPAATMSPPLPFGGGWTTANSTSELALSKPINQKKSPEIAEFLNYSYCCYFALRI
jgi:hypothetical protein